MNRADSGSSSSGCGVQRRSGSNALSASAAIAATASRTNPSAHGRSVSGSWASGLKSGLLTELLAGERARIGDGYDDLEVVGELDSSLRVVREGEEAAVEMGVAARAVGDEEREEKRA